MIFYFSLTAEPSCEEFINTHDVIGRQFLDTNQNPAQILAMTLIGELSDNKCVQDVTYFFAGSNVTAKDGCRGEFNVCYFDSATPKPETTESPLQPTTTPKSSGESEVLLVFTFNNTTVAFTLQNIEMLLLI